MWFGGLIRKVRRAARAHWSDIAFWLRVGAVAWVAAVGVFEALQFFGLLPQDHKLEPWVWSVSLVLLGVDNVGTLISRRLAKNRARRNDAITKALMALLIEITRNEPTLRFEKLGGNVFVTRRDGSVKRIVRFRPAGPQQSGIDWSDAKGAVGHCIRERRTIHKPWQAIARKYGSSGVSEERWAKMPAHTKHGFTHREFNSIVAKYSEILAEPIWVPGVEPRMIGVLTVDRAFEASDATFEEKLSAESVLQSVAASASVVGHTLHPREAQPE